MVISYASYLWLHNESICYITILWWNPIASSFFSLRQRFRFVDEPSPGRSGESGTTWGGAIGSCPYKVLLLKLVGVSTPQPLWKIWKSVGIIIPNWMEKYKTFQSTNQPGRIVNGVLVKDYWVKKCWHFCLVLLGIVFHLQRASPPCLWFQQYSPHSVWGNQSPVQRLDQGIQSNKSGDFSGTRKKVYSVQ
jgi:hypothetical protein